MKPMKPLSGMTPMEPMKPMDFGEPWWPSDLGEPSTLGAQDEVRYAVFPRAQRLLIKEDGPVTAYDTGDHQISGVSQAQSHGCSLSFTSRDGVVRLEELRRVG